MGIFSFIKNQHIESVEWLASNAQTIVYPFPTDNRMVKMGAQLTIRESQAAVFADDGKIADVFGPGRYVLSADLLPAMARLKSWEHSYRSPFSAAIYYVHTNIYRDITWAANSLEIEDEQFGAVKLKATGEYSFKISDVGLFMKAIFSSNQIYETAYIVGQHRGMINSSLFDKLAQIRIPLIELIERREELVEAVEDRLQTRFARLGVELSKFTIDTITLPDEIIGEIEERTRLKAEEEARIREEDETKACVHCEYELHPSMKFCPECGAKAY